MKSLFCDLIRRLQNLAALRAINEAQADRLIKYRGTIDAHRVSIAALTVERDNLRAELVGAEAELAVAVADGERWRIKYEALRGHPSTWTQEGDT